MATIAVGPELVGKTVWLKRRPGSPRVDRVRVEQVMDLDNGSSLVLGQLSYRPGGAYAETDSRGAFNCFVDNHQQIEEVS